MGWVGGHPSLPARMAPLRGPRRPGRPSVSSGDGRPRRQQLLPCPALMEKEATLQPADPGPRGRTHGGVVSARSCAQGRNRASSQSPRPGWHQPRARDGHTSSIRAGARPGGRDARGAASPARRAHRTARPPLGRACWGPGAPSGRGEGTGRHRREGPGRGAGLERPSPLTLSRTTPAVSAWPSPQKAPGPHPPATDPPGTPSRHPREQPGPCLSCTRGDRFWNFQLDPECVLAQETASEWVPHEVTETASLTPRASRSSQQTRTHEPQTTDSGKQTLRVNHWQGTASGARDGHSSPRTSSTY